MERVETLLKKLQNQVSQEAPVSQLLLTVQMLQAELLQLQSEGAATASSFVALVPPPVPVVPVPPSNITITETPAPVITSPEPEEKIIEVLQVDEAALEAELEEIKKNAEILQQISHHKKPAIVFEEEEDIPTLTHQRNATADTKKEINDLVSSNTPSLNDKLKQSSIDLGDTLVDQPIRDLRKAIGVNDRFLFINELFRGDESAYERSIKTINSFSIYPEAEYWIQRELKVKNGWKDTDEVVRQFYQLVRRRFA
ncbi:MAG: hypothetical protein U0X40_07850 [Ferruginibacter sp.]